MEAAAGWIGPAATMIAAMMTAANLGSRVTGWGFVIFVIGSISWSIVAIASGQNNLLWTNGFLTLVNLLGVWRWLGRQAKYDDGSADAARRSAQSSVPTLFSTSALGGGDLVGRDGQKIGTIVDAMAKCAGGQIEYFVVSTGGVGGVGERLHVLDPKSLVFTHKGIESELTEKDLSRLPDIAADQWPETFTPDIVR